VHYVCGTYNMHPKFGAFGAYMGHCILDTFR
jgi:hypothetical protein